MFSKILGKIKVIKQFGLKKFLTSVLCINLEVDREIIIFKMMMKMLSSWIDCTYFI